MATSKALNIGRLRRSVNASLRAMEPFRRNRKQQIRQLLGRNYSDEGIKESVPLNLIALAYSIHVHNLVANRPRIMSNTKIRELRPTAEDFRLSVDLLIDEINLVHVLRRCAAAALFGLSFAKIGLCEDESDSYERVAGSPFVIDVDADDSIVDMAARRWSQIAYIGNQYQIPLDELRESGLYKRRVVDKLSPQEDGTQVNEGGDEHISSLSVGNRLDDPYRQMVDVYDLWLPREKVVVTIPKKEINEALRVVEWTGPAHGPYHRLAFLDAPGQLMPIPPSAIWYDLHVLANALYRKSARQSLRQKSILGAVAEAREDADNIIKASDGDVIGVRVQGGVSEHNFGGPNQSILAMSVMAKDLFSYFAGNLDATGGLGPQSETLGQDQLIHESASRQLRDMQDRTVEFTTNIVRDLAYYRWHDPIRTDQLVKRIEGVDFDFPTAFGPLSRAGMLFNYQFEINPYSMQHRTPAMRLQTLMQMLNQVLMPMTPLMQSQGLALDAKEIIRTIALLSDTNEITDWVRYGPESGGTSLSDEGNGAPPSITSERTHRTYERISRPGRTRQATDYALAQTLLGGNVQNAEAAAATGIGAT